MMKCTLRHPPGNEIYRKRYSKKMRRKAESTRKDLKLAKKEKDEKKTEVKKYISFFEIDGRKNKVNNIFYYFHSHTWPCLTISEAYNAW